MRHMFESLGYQSGFFLSQLFSANRTNSPSSSSTLMKQIPTRPPPPIFNWNHPPLPSTSPLAPNFHPSSQIGLVPNNKDNATHQFLFPHHHNATMEGMLPDHHHHHDSDIKWPNGLSFFTALTGRSDDAKLLFGHEGSVSNKAQMNVCADAEEGRKEDNNVAVSGTNTEDYLGLERHSIKERKIDESKFKRTFTMPTRMATSSSSSTSLDQHRNQQNVTSAQGMEYRGSEAGIYSDIMETFLE